MIRIGILGAAGIAPQAVITPGRRRDDLVVHAVASRRPGTAERYAADHGIPVSYGSYEQLLDSPDVDVVYVALPPSEHVPWSMAALDAGKHVLCEKPIAMDAAEAAELAAAANRAGLHVMEAFHDHYHPLMRHLVDLRRTEALGELIDVEATFTADNPYFPGSIRHVPALGGGALMDLGCYPVHWVRTFLGTEPHVRGASAQPGPEGADETIDVDLTAGETSISLRASMAPGVPFSATFDATGARGTLHVDNVVLPHRGHSVTVVQDKTSRTYTIGGNETYDYQLDALVHALTSGEPADTEGQDFVATMNVIDEIYAEVGMSRVP